VNEDLWTTNEVNEDEGLIQGTNRVQKLTTKVSLCLGHVCVKSKNANSSLNNP
jgi:hypothetical protein